MKSLFLVESTKNLNLPIGGGLWTPVLHPEDAPATPYSSWTFRGAITGMPEFTAPKLGKFNNTVSMEVDVPANANGVLYSLGAFSGGLSCYVKDGVLCYEYNLFEITRTHIKAKTKLPTGKVKIEVVSTLASAKPAAPLNVTLIVNGKTVAEGQVPMTAPFTFTANDCLDIGSDLGSPVSIEYYDDAPFKFNGTIGTTKIAYPKK
jgi:arylsulfatase